MMVDTRHYGYYSGEACSTSCIGCQPEWDEAAPPNVYRDAEGQIWYAIFSHEDDGYGLYCDSCGDVIFEASPEADHENGLHEADDELVPDECDVCREYMTDHAGHDVPWLFTDWCGTCDTLQTDALTGHDNGEHDTYREACLTCHETLAREAVSAELWYEQVKCYACGHPVVDSGPGPYGHGTPAIGKPDCWACLDCEED